MVGAEPVGWRRDATLATAAALDIGLITFLVAPGLLPVTQGMIGPVLVAIQRPRSQQHAPRLPDESLQLKPLD